MDSSMSREDLEIELQMTQDVICDANARIKDLEAIGKAHQKENAELQVRIKELEALLPTKEEASEWIKRLKDSPVMHGDKQLDLMLYQDIVAKLQRIAGRD